jgi:hypothetical protein
VTGATLWDRFVASAGADAAAEGGVTGAARWDPLVASARTDAAAEAA